MRSMAANYTRKNPKSTINGCLIKLAISHEFNTVEDYVEGVILKLGEDARDLALFLIPLTLRINVRIVSSIKGTKMD